MIDDRAHSLQPAQSGARRRATWLAIRSVEDGRLDMGSVGIVIRREEEPTSFWALLTGLVVSIVALLLIGATLITVAPCDRATDPQTPLAQLRRRAAAHRPRASAGMHRHYRCWRGVRPAPGGMCDHTGAALWADDPRG